MRKRSRSLPALIAAAALTVSAAACTSDAGDAPPRTAPPTTSSAPPAAVSQSFSLRIGSGRGPTPPALARHAGTTVISYDNAFRAVDARGVTAWSFRPTDQRAGYGPAFTVDGDTTVLYWFATGGKERTARIRAVDTATGAVRWTSQTPGYVDAVTGALLLTPCSDGYRRCSVRALDTRTGAEKWTRSVDGPAYVRESVAADDTADGTATTSSVVVDVTEGDVSSEKFHVEAFDLATGTSRRLSTPPGGFVRAGDAAAFAIADENPRDGCAASVVGIDLTTGRRTYSHTYPLGRTTQNTCALPDPSVPAAGTVAVRIADGQQVALDVRTGRTLSTTRGVTGTLAGHADGVTVVHEGEYKEATVRGIRDGGAQLWSRAFTGHDTDEAAVVRGLVVLGTPGCEGACSVLRPATGAVAGSVTGVVVGHGEDWVATFEDDETLHVYGVRG